MEDEQTKRTSVASDFIPIRSGKALRLAKDDRLVVVRASADTTIEDLQGKSLSDLQLDDAGVTKQIGVALLAHNKEDGKEQGEFRLVVPTQSYTFVSSRKPSQKPPKITKLEKRPLSLPKGFKPSLVPFHADISPHENKNKSKSSSTQQV